MVSTEDRDFDAIVATVNAAQSYGEAAERLGMSRQRLSQLLRLARERGYRVVDGRRAGRPRLGVDLNPRNREIYRLFSDGNVPYEEIANRYKMHRDHIKKIVRGELRRLGLSGPGVPRRQLPREGLDPDRPRCACGLTLDEDHQPEACDMRGRTARLAEQRCGHWSDLQGEDYHW